MIKINSLKCIIPLSAALLLFCSCKKTLEVPPSTELESNYFTDESRVEKGIGAIYASLDNIYAANLGFDISQTGVTLHPAWLLQGDDLTTNSTTNAAYEAFSGFSPSDARIGPIWQKYYFTINRANFMLERLELPEISAIISSPEIKGGFRGEALFLRAYINFKLWDIFRKAPLQPSRITSVSNAVLPPSKDFELLDAAIADLTEAASLLPETRNQKNKGRVTKNSARGLLVKCYTLRANYADQYSGGNRPEDYAKAIATFEQISSENTITGVPFGSNFDYRTENNAESLFEYQAGHNQREDNAWLDNDYGQKAGSVGVMYLYFSDHWANYGIDGGCIGPTTKLISSFDPNDPRRDETFKLAQDVDNIGGKIWWMGYAWGNFGGYQFVKYVNGPRGDCYDASYQVQSSNNPRILRLADVKLLAAEAYLQTGNAGKATQQVNDIRKRARFSTSSGNESPVPADYATVTMQQIMDERYLELAGEENIRWSDLRRWHAAGFINLGNWKVTDFGYPFDPSLFSFDVDKHLLFPIPSSEINANPLLSADGNNPGYN